MADPAYMPTTPMTTPPKYDIFLSYRRQEPDKGFARQLLRDLEAAGYKVAIDERDFRPNIPFLQEMERCVTESRFTLAVVTPRYLDSGNAEEEGIVATVQDMRDRKRRLIPLYYEKTRVPDWMYSLTGIHFDDPDPLVPPLIRLTDAIAPPF